MTIVTAYLECLNHLPMPTFANYDFAVFHTRETVHISQVPNESRLIASSSDYQAQFMCSFFSQFEWKMITKNINHNDLVET